MTPTVHTFLYHGADIIKWCVLPTGQLSEEVQEARNKDLRRYRELHTRKISREATNRDLLNRILVSADPAISNIRNKTVKQRMDIPLEALQLTNTEIPLLFSETSDSDTNSDTSDSYNDVHTDF